MSLGAVLLNRDDPIYAFEHMMQHRQYFAVMGDHSVQGGLAQFSVLPYILDPTQDSDNPAWSWNQRHQQAHNDFNKDLPANFNNGYTATTITPVPATGTGNSPGAQVLDVSGVTNLILIGSVVAGTGVPTNTHILQQLSGTSGKDGRYVVDQPLTPLTNVAMTFTVPPYQKATPITGQTFGIHQSGILIEGDGGSPENRAMADPKNAIKTEK